MTEPPAPTLARGSFAPLLNGVLPTLGAAGLVALTLAVAAIAAHSTPMAAYRALASGAFGDLYSIGETLTRTVPLMFTALGVALAFQCGVWNIGADGQFLVGAIAAMAMLRVWPAPPSWAGIPLLIAAGAAAGALWALLPAVLKVRRRASEVISTIMLNFIAMQLLSWVIRGPLQEGPRRYPQSDEVPAALQLWRLLPPTRLHIGLAGAVLAAIALGFFLYRTTLGFQIRATGQNETAARASGIPVDRAVIAAMALGGGLAGLGGAVELMGVTFRLYEPFSSGYGYTAIAAALLGGLKPGGVAVAALLFGALDAGSRTLQTQAGIPSVMVSVIQGVILLFVAWRRTASA